MRCAALRCAGSRSAGQRGKISAANEEIAIWVQLAVDGRKYTRRMPSYIAARDDLLSGGHDHLRKTGAGDMAREDHQQAVLTEFRKQLARDRTRTTVSGFSQLGVVELTRKRTRESLAHMLCEPCPTCAGRGQVKTARSVCYDILREILREARQFNPKEFRIVASAAVVEMFLDEESVHLAGLSEFIGKPISLSTEPSMNPEQYDIVLM